MARWWYGGDGPHLPSMPFEAALQSRGTGKAGENGQSSLAPGRGRRIRPSVPPRGNSGGPPGALAPCGWLRKWRSGCRGSLSTGSPAGHLNMGDADEAPMHGGSMYSQAHVSPRRESKRPGASMASGQRQTLKRGKPRIPRVAGWTECGYHHCRVRTLAKRAQQGPTREKARVEGTAAGGCPWGLVSPTAAVWVPSGLD